MTDVFSHLELRALQALRALLGLDLVALAVVNVGPANSTWTEAAVEYERNLEILKASRVI